MGRGSAPGASEGPLDALQDLLELPHGGVLSDPSPEPRDQGSVAQGCPAVFRLVSESNPSYCATGSSATSSGGNPGSGGSLDSSLLTSSWWRASAGFSYSKSFLTGPATGSFSASQKKL